MPPPAEHRKRPQDGISRVQKVAAVEIGFRGAPGCFRGTLQKKDTSVTFWAERNFFLSYI